MRIHGTRSVLLQVAIVLMASLILSISAQDVIKARYVHVTVPGNGRYLSLAEVQVMSGGRNVALKKRVVQSSDYGAPNAHKAVDGNTSGEWGRGSITHTGQEKSPRWEVDLGTEMSIQSVSLWNRDGLEKRLHGVEVRLLDGKRRLSWATSIKTTENGENKIAVRGPSTIGKVGELVASISKGKPAKAPSPKKPAGPPQSYGTIESLAMAINDMAKTWPDRFKDYDSLLSELKAIPPGDATALKAFQKRVLLRNPMLDFDKLMVIRRKKGSFLTNNWLSNSRLPKKGHDNEIVILSINNPKQETVIYRPKDGEFVGDVDLHWNADRMLFSSIGSNGAWQIMEIGTDGKDLRQVTQTEETFIHNYDPCYLPDGRIIFTSTAPMVAVPCINGGASISNLFRCNSDGTGMEQLCFDQEHNWSPQVMNDGKILYLRWEYTDLPHSNSRILMTMNPDGTNQRSYYGTNSWWPNGIFYARQIPSKPFQFVGIVTGHHGVKREGELILFDTAKGYMEADGVVQRMPGYGKEVKPIVADRLVDRSPNRSIHPYPLGTPGDPRGTGTYFLSCFKTGKTWGVYLVDRFDNRTFICEGIEPVPIQKQPIPPVIPNRVRAGEKEANVFISDIYEGPGLEGVPRGAVKSLRLFTYTYGNTKKMAGLYGVIGMDGPWDMRRVLGTVPVDADGSASFKVPANTPISIQPLDAEGKALQIMRSWYTARPGENISCIGCHEAPSLAPPMRLPTAAKRRPSAIEPWNGPVRNYEFAREVQPVLDANCNSCHASSKPTGDDLTIAFKGTKIPYFGGDAMIKSYKTKMPGNGGGNAGKFSVAYFNLFRYTRHSGIESEMQLQMPMEFHADTTELIAMLEKGHPSTGSEQLSLRKEHMDRLVTWIDLNRPYYGRWSQRMGDMAINAEKQRAEMRKRYGGVDENHEELPPVASIAKVNPVPAPTHATLNVEMNIGRRPKEATQEISLDDGVELALAYIPSGQFAMGSTSGFRDEAPMTKVTIPNGFWMGKMEVTNRQFACFAPSHDSRREDRHGYQFGAKSLPVNAPDQPAVRLSWKHAQDFCTWLSKKTGRTVRLPTEAEWEWACRAGTSTDMSYGPVAADFSKHGNMADISLHHFSMNPYSNDWKKSAYKNSENIYDNWVPQVSDVNDGAFLSVPGGKYTPNAWGLHDMHGNVWEWTASLYRPYPYKGNDGRNDATSPGKRVIRGGSWYDRPKWCTSSVRRAYRDYQKVYNVGFRIVVEE